jgi:outer membrane protein insertion porin family
MVKQRILLTLVCLCAAAFSLCQGSGSIVEIVINGNKSVSKDAILATMRTKVGQNYVQDQLDQDKESIYRMGFFQAVDVRAKSITDTTWQVLVDVSEFPTIKEIRVTGNNSVHTEDILNVIGLKVGQVYNANSARIASDAIRKLYTDKGYFATVDQFGPMQESPNTIQVGIVELVVNSVTTNGNKKTRASVMKKLIKIRPGDAYNMKKWDKDRTRVYNTQWFETVKSSETISEEGVGRVDLALDLKEARTGQFNLGMQIDPKNGIAGFFRVAESNFNGTGQDIGITVMQSISSSSTFSSSGSVSDTNPSIDLSYTNPFIDNHDTSMSVQLYSRLIYRFSGQTFGGSSSSSVDRYAERRTGASMMFSRPIGQDIFGTIGGRFEEIKTDTSVGNSMTNNYILQDGRLAVLTLATTMNRRDVDIDPSRGDWMRLSVEPGYSEITKVGGLFPNASLLGSDYFVRNTMEYRRYYTTQPPRGRELDAPRRVFAFRVKTGAISGDVPFFEQFFAGGSDTLRGYDEDRFWGKYTLLSTLEYRHPIQKAFNAILFMDYGGAWGGYGPINDYSQSKDLDLHLGYGIGFSFRTPFGPLRLDFGFGEDGKSHTHFMMGTSF